MRKEGKERVGRPVKVAFLGSRPISLRALDIVLEAMQGNGQDWVDLSVFAESDNDPPEGIVRWWELGRLKTKALEDNIRLIGDKAELLSERFDLITMVFHNYIIPSEVIERVPCGITNLHFGYLPTEGYSQDVGSPHKSNEPYSRGIYRGSNVLSHAILQGERWQAVTFHFITEKIDLGLVIEYAWNPVDKDTTAWDLQLASEEKALTIFRKYFPILIDRPDSIQTLSPGRLKYPYYNRQSLDSVKVLDPHISDKRLNLLARALSFPNTEPAYFLEAGMKRYVIYKKGEGVKILEPTKDTFIQRLEDIT